MFLMSERIDFFISHSHVDKKWAEWIANLLEQEGYSTFWGDRDLKVGDNFVLIIQEYIEKADKFIAVFSPSYFSSTFCQAEVSAMLAKKKDGIIPVKVSDAQPIGELANVLYVDLYNINETEAKKRLLTVIATHKQMLSSKPKFPETKDNEKNSIIETRFPGAMPINNLKFSNEKLIIGGNEKVKAIRQAFEKNNTVSSTLALSGLGGIGKTVIAQKYIYQYGYLYNLIWWINAQSKDSVIHAYDEFVIRNNLTKNTDYKQNMNAVVDIVKKWMLETDNWLFVFDGVVDFEIIQSFIPEKHKGNVLITSRDSLWKNSDVSAIKMDVFSIETATKFLKQRGVRGKDEDLIKLSTTLGNIPLNLEVAAKYIVENNLTVIDFLSRYNNLEENDTNSPSTYINIASVYKEQGDFENALKYYHKSLELLDKGQSSNYVTVYNSIASVYQEMGDYDMATQIYRKVLDIISEGLNDYRVDINSFDIGTTYNNLATILREQHKYEEAIQLYNKALVIFKETFNNEHPSVATTLNNLAIVYCDLREYAHALQYYYEALLIREKILGLNHPDTAKTYIGIAEIYNMQKDYEKSIMLYEKALNIYNNALGTENSYVATVYTKIASTYQKRGNYQEALDYYNMALKLQDRPVALNEVVSNFINFIGEDNSITNITNLTEKSLSLGKAKEIIDELTRKVLNDLESSNKEDYNLFSNNFSEIQRTIRIIREELIFETTDETEICHYSKLATLKYVIRVKDCTPQPRLRISNIAYLNDPSEGNVLLRLLKNFAKSNAVNMLLNDENVEENKLVEVPFSKVFIGSFSTAKNKLPMWTLYGDDSKGCCLVFDDYFFDKKNELIEAKSNVDDKSVSSQELILYRVKYLDIENLDESDSIVGRIKKIAVTLDVLEELITKYESVRVWVMALLDEIRFLFKDSDYDYENEVRIIIHAENSEIQVDDGQNELNIPRLYVDLQIKLIYKEIILGSKIDKPNAVAPFLLHSGMVKKVTKSGINYQ